MEGEGCPRVCELSDSDPETQRQRLLAAGVAFSRIYQDVGISGTSGTNSRRGWHSLDSRLAQGDTLAVVSIDRIGRRWLDTNGQHARPATVFSLEWQGPAEAGPCGVDFPILRNAWSLYHLQGIDRYESLGVRVHCQHGVFQGHGTQEAQFPVLSEGYRRGELLSLQPDYRPAPGTFHAASVGELGGVSALQRYAEPFQQLSGGPW